MQRVRCPGCGLHDFAEWSAGWDAHAAHRCEGMTGETSEERKAEYRQRFVHLFRGDGRAAAPSRQRDVMRRIYSLHGPDEEGVVHEYAAAERRGEVRRARNPYGMSPEEYARRLLADGLNKGWLRPRS